MSFQRAVEGYTRALFGMAMGDKFRYSYSKRYMIGYCITTDILDKDWFGANKNYRMPQHNAFQLPLEPGRSVSRAILQ